MHTRSDTFQLEARDSLLYRNAFGALEASGIVRKENGKEGVTYDQEE